MLPDRPLILPDVDDDLPGAAPAPELRSLRAAFATRIMKAGTDAMIIYPNNKAMDIRMPVAAAVETGYAFMVEVAEDVLAVDCDRPDLGPAVISLAWEIESDGHRTVTVNSGSPGHQHLFSRVSNPGALARYKALAKSYGLDVRDGIKQIRPPLAPHREGRPVSLVEDVAEALASLTPPKTSPRRPLSTRIARLLRDGDTTTRYASRSEVIQAIATGAHAKGWAFGDFVDAMLDPANAAGEKARGRKDPVKYLRHCWAKAAAFTGKHPASEAGTNALARIVAVRDAAESSTWKGRAGLTGLAVIRAHASVALRAGSLEHGLSAREAAEITGVPWQTVTRSWGRLIRDGWLRRLSRDSGPSPSRWTLTVPEKRNPTRHSSSTMGGCDGNVSSGYVSDLWRWGGRRGRTRVAGLGKAAGRIYGMLPATVRVMSGAAGTGDAAVRKQLRKLADVGLVVRDGRTWRRTTRTPDDVAEAMGIAGESERQKARHKREREAYADSLRRREAWRDRERRDAVRECDRRMSNIASSWAPNDNDCGLI